jgi:glycosyltransferase involved in cell wall biosynthesis
MFRPKGTEKNYDVCFMANATQQSIKRHALLIEQFANTPHTILNLGNIDRKLVKLARQKNVDITWGDWSLRKFLPEKISQCRVGICCSTNYDSCPRVIPEYLACGLPVVATKNINFWQDKYINQKTGILVGDDYLVDGVKFLLDRMKSDVEPLLDPLGHYERYICMDRAVSYLEGLIRENCF